MKLLWTLIFLFSLKSHSQELIDCSDGTCSYAPALNVTTSTDFINYSKFEINGLTDNLAIEVPNGNDPRNFRGYVRTNSLNGRDIDMSLSSSVDGKDASKFVFIVDSVNELNITSNGKNGEVHQSASEICAQKTLAGDYGGQALSEFNQRRTDNPTLPTDRCVEADLLSIQAEDHSCSPGYTKLETSSISAQRWIGRQKCEGDAARKLCLKRKMKIECQWQTDRYQACCDTEVSPVGENWSCDVAKCDADHNGWIKNFEYIKYESTVDNIKYGPIGAGNDIGLCNYLSGRNYGADEIINEHNWHGYFSGSYYTRNLNVYPPANPNRKYLGIEFAVGGVAHSCDNSGCLTLPGMSDYTIMYPDNAGYIGFKLASGGNIFNYGIKCEWKGTFAECLLAKNAPEHSLDSDGVLTQGHSLYKYTSISYMVKFYFVDQYGVLRTRTVHKRVGHE